MVSIGNRPYRSLTLEPFIVLFTIVWYIPEGSQIQRNLLMWKICHIEMNYSHVICDNIYDYEDVSSEVQVRLNDFEMVSELLSI